MKLQITNILGPMHKPSHTFDGEKQIAIGRNPKQCQITYPVDFTTVGRKHLVIEEDAGKYELRVNTSNPVYLDGLLIGDDVEVPESCVIALGTKDGPSFKIELLDDNELPKTVDYGKQDELHTTVKKSGAWLKIALVMIIAVGGGFGYKSYQTQHKIESMKLQANEMFKDVYSTIDLDIGSLANTLSSSVYLVLVKGEYGETPMGTAWVASNNSLATNSHVAQIFNELPENKDLKFVVRSTVPPYKEFNIKKVAMHPAYNAFQEAWEEADPQQIQANGSSESVQLIPGYDVALLYPDNADGLAKPLMLASKEELNDLTSGIQVAYIGFPMEGVITQAFTQPSPVIQVANITSITDFFRGQASFVESQLIQHSLPATGGASGSPIINNKGKVIALLNAGNVTGVDDNGNRIASAVAINYAQRVDLLDNLLKHGDNFAIGGIVSAWNRGFARYANMHKVGEVTVKVIKQQILDDWKYYYGIEESNQLLNSEVIIHVDDRIYDIPATLVEFTAPKTGSYMINAIDAKEGNIDLLVGELSNDQINLIGRDMEGDYYPSIDLELSKGDAINIYVLHSDLEYLDINVTKPQLFIYVN